MTIRHRPASDRLVARMGARIRRARAGQWHAPGKWLAGVACAVAGVVILTAAVQDNRAPDDAVITAEGYPATLSAYGFFTDTARRMPAARVTAYALNTPLFSDYAEKQRYLYVPAGQKAAYDPEAVLQIPVGGALIKTFGYRENGQFRAVETRVLLHRASGWAAIPYVWNADGSDAVLKRGGARIPVTFTDPAGQRRSISYAVPNQNQCKECHALSGAVTPIGPKIRNLNDGKQLQALLAAGMIDRLPADAPRLARWDDEAAPLADRATAYLEANCAHCHNRAGAASNSGLFFGWHEANATARGLMKRPVAAGRGSGGDDFDIEPGHPERSILLYRLGSTDPGIAMPELGRQTVHAEGVKLLTRWIAAMPQANGGGGGRGSAGAGGGN